MTSPVPVVIALLKASTTVGARVGERIDPEIAKGDALPRVVVRQSSGRQFYGIEGAVGLRETQVTVLCAASSFTSADILAETVRDALKDVQGARVAQHKVWIRQNGEDLGSATQDAKTFQRITGYQVTIGDA